ncbi:sulfate ABC transporter substrate-binding protein [Lonepinella sp. MS14435]|uniref:sulfate ABC transporter substrate-binding protein n=1 Tax=Lonepinella sp. MS14435 TaxID=3003618 RepID=UPI0036D7DABC
MKLSKKFLAFSLGVTLTTTVYGKDLLNVSYDPTRELYKEYNALFAQHWEQQTGEKITLKASHGGSSKQARSVIDGLQADVVTLAMSGDIDALNKHQQLLDPNWQQRLDHNSTPYTSTIVFLVRKGNPKNIKDWDDLTKDESLQVITPNPKTSGGARWNFLAAWTFAKQKYGSEDKALEFVTQVYKQTPVLDTGARGSTMTFVQRNKGDVLLAWENEAHLALNEEGGDQLEIVTPSISILAEPPVALVDSVVDKKGTRKEAEAYLKYLYSDEAQRIIAKNFYRPINPAILKEFSATFADVKLFNVKEIFGGGWEIIQPKFFDDNGIFDQILEQIHR